MALTTEPTDAEILDLWESFVGEPMEEIPLSDSDKLCFARAALRSWGQPSGVGDGRMSEKMRDHIKGMSVSVDVSTGDHDAGNRYFGTVTEVMDDIADKHGVVLLVQDAEPNFAPQPIQAVSPAAQWKDHQTAALVNELRDCAKEFHGTQQLRERLLHILRPLIDWVRAAQAVPPAGREPLTGEQIQDAAPKYYVEDFLDFNAGVRFAEQHHGIKGKEAGNAD